MTSRRVLAAVMPALALLTTVTAAAPIRHAPRYVLRSLEFPSGMALQQRAGPRPLEPPLALAANGAVAALAVGFRGGYESTAEDIVVWRSDGTRTVIGLPSRAAMAGAFHHLTSNMGSSFPFVEFLRVVLAADGTPFATVSSTFSGAYTGSDLGIFRWTGARWIVVAGSSRPPFTDPPDYRVVAAELPKLRVATTRDYSSAVYNVDAGDFDPHYREDEAWILTGKTWHRLGFGDLTSLAGPFACGYISYIHRHPILERPTRAQLQPIALLWKGGRVTRLGAGVAFGVNAEGAAVGDDRATIDGMTIRNQMPGPIGGVPVLWKAGTKTQLATRTGTAYAVGDDGTVVGTFADGRGFIVRDGVRHELDATIVRGLRRRRITGAFAVNARGRILVTTVGADGYGVGVLDPVP